MISDRHGMRASIEAGIEEVEVHGMHDGDKVGASSLGDLVHQKLERSYIRFHKASS